MFLHIKAIQTQSGFLPGFRILILILPFLVVTHTQLFSQCTNINQFPPGPIQASPFNDARVVTEEQEAGQYYVIRGLAVNKTYQFASSAPGDFITVRDRDGITALAFGVSPVSYMVTGDDIVTVHINLSAGCGTETAFRTTTATCVDCPDVPGRFGIAEADPVATLDVQGGVRVGNITRQAEAGMIRWNEAAKDFEGFDGTKWRSFTKAQGGWGIDANPDATETQVLNTLDTFPETVSLVGYPIDIFGDYMIQGFGNNAYEVPYVYIFRYLDGCWTQAFEINASDTIAPDTISSGFGGAVDMYGDRVIIGAPRENTGNRNAGAAYIYKRSGATWILEEKLWAFDGDTLDNFGVKVAISDQFAMVGASEDDIGGNEDQGSVYVFKRSGNDWLFLSKITASNAQASGYFGSAIALDGEQAVIGAYAEDVNTTEDQGAVYVFEKQPNDTWTEQARLIALDGQPDAWFGLSVDIQDTIIVIGAQRQEVETFLGAGSAYVFKKNGLSWQEEQILFTNDPNAGDRFGNAVSVQGNNVAVSARGKDINGNLNHGTVYVYRFQAGEWELQKRLLPSDGDNNTFVFGWDMCIDGNMIGVSAGGGFTSQTTPADYLRQLYIFQKE